MINLASNEIVETIKMIRDEHLDIRTITMGISLLTVPMRIADAPVQRYMTRLCAVQKIL